jgi:hypothetical protein
MKKNKVVWGPRGWFPAYYGFCPSKKAWKAQKKKIGMSDEYPETDGSCSSFWDTKTRKTIILVTISDRIDKTDHVGIMGLLVHEAAHVWQFACEDAGDTHPSREAEAYGIQTIFLSLLDAYSTTRKIKGI